MLWVYLICLWFLIGAVTGFYIFKEGNGVVRIRNLPAIAFFTLFGLISVILLFWLWLQDKITDEQYEKFMNKKIF